MPLGGAPRRSLGPSSEMFSAGRSGWTATSSMRRARGAAMLRARLPDEVREELVMVVEQPAVAEQHGRDDPQGRPRGDEEHDDNLIFHGVNRGDAGEELPGHHPGQAHDADD